MTAPALKLGQVLETALYVDDIGRSRRFFEEALGLETLFCDARLCAFDCGPGSVLLVFTRGSTSKAVHLPGGDIPAHGACGRLHAAFAITRDELPAWERRLEDKGVAIEARMKWPRGGESLYFRDPDENLLELATPGLWRNY